ncbi:hypothetical protein CVT24_009890 [Panaeolus cyanescens]|uniref:Uncharacterized protein n=1 Tax=Panaeolus cyanescens TaxID=181874 RepID=A0A409WFK5_9AGAR|nr:hypothetical protein CVT24_009890 [Panaeolus cyanescens]
MNRKKNIKKTVTIDSQQPAVVPVTPADILSTTVQPPQSAHMPGSFGSSTVPSNRGISSQTAGGSSATPVITPPSVSMRFSPSNPFQVLVPAETEAPGGNDSGTPVPASESRFQQAPELQTPRVTVTTTNSGPARPYNSPGIAGPDSFGLSVSHHDLWATEDEEQGVERQDDEADSSNENEERGQERLEEKVEYGAAVKELEPIGLPCVFEHECKKGPDEYEAIRVRYEKAVKLAEGQRNPSPKNNAFGKERATERQATRERLEEAEEVEGPVMLTTHQSNDEDRKIRKKKERDLKDACNVWKKF